MKSKSYLISKVDLERLQMNHPNLGKNKDVGDYGVQVAALYLESIGAINIVIEPEAGIDISAFLNGKLLNFEVKATVDSEVAFSKLKISSTRSHDLLVNGMEVMRICKIGEPEVDIHFLKYGEDFDLVPEPRWRVKKL